VQNFEVSELGRCGGTKETLVLSWGNRITWRWTRKRLCGGEEERENQVVSECGKEEDAQNRGTSQNGFVRWLESAADKAVARGNR